MKDAVYRSKFCQSYCDLWYSRYWNKHAHRQALSAGCVRKSDDSRNSAIRIAYRISLRSSSSWEPRYPSLKIFLVFYSLVILGLENRFKDVLGIIQVFSHNTQRTSFRFWICVNDPSAGSPTETLLRLLLPLSDKVYLTFRDTDKTAHSPKDSPDHSKSVGATGGVYKGQGLNQRKLMTCAY